MLARFEGVGLLVLVLVLLLLVLYRDSGRSRSRCRRVGLLGGPSVLPLPVEFVAGGDGKPELDVVGLCGSGSAGRLASWAADNFPRYMADVGRESLAFGTGRGVIEDREGVKGA